MNLQTFHKFKTLTIISFFIAIVNVNAQNTPCSSINIGSYWPLEVGKKIEMRGQKTEFVEIDSIITFNGIQYFRQKTNSIGQKERISYYRVIGDSAILSYDVDKKTESTQLKLNPFVNQEWIDEDGDWFYKVIDLNFTYRTPYCTFDSVLALKCSPTISNTKIKYKYCTLLFKRGIGLIGIYIEENPYNFIVTSNSKSFSSPYLSECKDQTGNKLECTSRILGEYISKIKLPKNVKGKASLLIEIDETGNVTKISCLKSEFDYNLVKNKLEEIFLGLNFEPGLENNIPSKKNLALPINFK